KNTPYRLTLTSKETGEDHAISFYAGKKDGNGKYTESNESKEIPLGDNCIVDAGIAVLEGTKFLLKDREELAKLNPYFDFSKEI
ncbi:hypothetical protein VWM73_12625, partial [Campylobacter coli]